MHSAPRMGHAPGDAAGQQSTTMREQLRRVSIRYTATTTAVLSLRLFSGLSWSAVQQGCAEGVSGTCLSRNRDRVSYFPTPTYSELPAVPVAGSLLGMHGQIPALTASKNSVSMYGCLPTARTSAVMAHSAAIARRSTLRAVCFSCLSRCTAPTRLARQLTPSLSPTYSV